MANEREQELLLLGKLISKVEAMDDKLDTFSSGVYKRIGKAEDNITKLASEMRQNREKDLKTIADLDKQVSKNTWIIGVGSAIAFSLLVALLKAEII